MRCLPKKKKKKKKTFGFEIIVSLIENMTNVLNLLKSTIWCYLPHIVVLHWSLNLIR